MPDFDPLDGRHWELDPSTRDSAHIWTKSMPVDVTLTTPGTAQNLYLISFERPTVNLITNPSFETGNPPTGFTLSGSSLAQSVAVAQNGSNSIEVTPDNAAAGEGFYFTSPSIGGTQDKYLLASVYLRDIAASGNGVRIIIANSSGVALSTGNTVALSTSWQRSAAAYPIAYVAGATYRIYVVTATQFATVFHADSMQLEIGTNISHSAYCDGSLGLNYEWYGTAHASMSRRKLGLGSVRGYTLHTTRDIYISYDIDASSSTGEFKRAGTDFWVDFPMEVESRISFINAVSGEQPRVYGRLWGLYRR